MSRQIGVVLAVIGVAIYAAFIVGFVALAGQLADVVERETRVLQCRADCRINEFDGSPIPIECREICNPK